MAKTTRGSNWPDDEITDLIDIWKEPELREKIDSKSRCKTDIWIEIATRLFHLGYPARTGPQVHNKIKDLRRSYVKANTVRETVRPSPSGSDAGLVRQFPFYHMLHEVIGNKPVSRPSLTGGEGDDSSTDALDTSSSNSTNWYALSDEENDQDDEREQNEHTRQVAEREHKNHGNNQESPGNDKKDVENKVEGVCNNVQVEGRGQVACQQPSKGKKRQRLSMKDRTVEALAKRMKEITAASDRKFLEIEERRRKEELEQRREDRKCLLSILELIKQGMEDRKHAEEKRSRDFQTMMTVFNRNLSTNSATFNENLTDNTQE
ncbi:uncharacterized protein LOC117101147 [Anneissia japonica]|uniref:uncharacterized protein LOC117101147 n=1 Tax=Anneissia japonica TaxID=1529436 RepID=UPI0014259C36|nr:uncharacterized protein LOC117101147 [Anneissia japonica]